MRKTLLTYVKPHVQEDPLAMILGIAYLGACLEKERIPVELTDERIVNDQEMREAIERNDIIGFDALTPNIRRAIAWRSEEHTSELQSRGHLVCRLLLE